MRIDHTDSFEQTIGMCCYTTLPIDYYIPMHDVTFLSKVLSFINYIDCDQRQE